MTVQPLIWWHADPARWSALDYVEARDEHGITGDKNGETRSAVLDMVAQDKSSVDAEFIRHLLRQETAMHGASWGYGDSLGLASLLLAERGVVNDVWLLWEAKNATFDTYSGLNGAVLFGAGITETLAHVEASDHSDRDELLDYLTWLAENELEDDEEVGQHLAGLRSYLTSRPE